MFGFRRPRPHPVPADPGRRAAVARAKRLAGGDSHFLNLIGQADQARHQGDWHSAARHYREALQSYPLHGGYWVQLGHVLKESGSWASAEIAYRSAMALGEREVGYHLAFVVERAGRAYDRRWAEAVAGYWGGNDPSLFAAPATRDDVALLIELLCDRGDSPDEEMRDLLASHTSLRGVMAAILGGAESRHYHADLLRLIQETGWGE